MIPSQARTDICRRNLTEPVVDVVELYRRRFPLKTVLFSVEVAYQFLVEMLREATKKTRTVSRG